MKYSEKTKVRLYGTYRWPLHVMLHQPAFWAGLDLSPVFGKKLPGFCAYYGSAALDFVKADADLGYRPGPSRVPTHQFAYFEITAYFSNPATNTKNSIGRWKHVDTSVLDLRQGRYPRFLLPILESIFQTKSWYGIVAALNEAPNKAREIVLALPHLEAVIFPVQCADQVTRLLMWVVSPEQAIATISPTAIGLAFTIATS